MTVTNEQVSINPQSWSAASNTSMVSRHSDLDYFFEPVARLLTPLIRFILNAVSFGAHQAVRGKHVKALGVRILEESTSISGQGR